MRLRISSVPVLAFLLVPGVAATARAQDVAETPGIMIRVDRPAANAWVKIDGGIDIRILTYGGLLDRGLRVYATGTWALRPAGPPPRVDLSITIYMYPVRVVFRTVSHLATVRHRASTRSGFP